MQVPSIKASKIGLVCRHIDTFLDSMHCLKCWNLKWVSYTWWDRSCSTGNYAWESTIGRTV